MVTTKRRPVASRTPARKTAQRGRHQGTRKRAPASPPDGLGRHGTDLWAIGLITLGVLLALGLWGRALGPVGHGVDVGLAALVGWTRVVIPIVCAGAGAVLLVERDRPDPLRIGLGALLGVVGLCGLGELAEGDPPLTLHPSRAMEAAGGWVGAVFGHPLHAGIGTAGSAVLFAALVFVAALIATGISLATFGRAVRSGAGALTSTLASWWSSTSLLHPAEGSGDEPAAPPAPPLRDPPAAVTLYDEEEQETDGHDAGPVSEAEPPDEAVRAPAVVSALPRAGGTGCSPTSTCCRPPSS